MDIAEFLLARIAEDETVAVDEAVARASAGTVVLGATYDAHPDREAVRVRVQEGVVDVHRKRPWTSPWGVTRVLAECEAKRRIVELHKPWHGSYECPTCSDGAGLDHGEAVVDRLRTPCPTLRLLALPHADHPDYDPAWSVTTSV